MTEQSLDKWYYQKTIVLTLIVLFFPVGLVLLWKSPKFSDEGKWIVSGIFGVLVATSMYMDSPKGSKKNDPYKRYWGNIEISLKQADFIGRNVTATFLFKNLTSKEENFSSLGQTEAISDEGDVGEFLLFESKCDGTIPPNGLFKCSITYQFPMPPNEVNFRLGAGILVDAVYFKLKK